MIAIRFDPKDKARGVGAVMVRDGYMYYMGDVIWVRPAALNLLNELGIPYQRVNGDLTDGQATPVRKKKTLRPR
jgi:hypothetical protein